MAKHFIVTDKYGTKRLISAKNKSEALTHVIGSEYTCEVARAGDVVDMFKSGAVLEEVPETPKKRKNAEAQHQESVNADNDDAPQLAHATQGEDDSGGDGN